MQIPGSHPTSTESHSNRSGIQACWEIHLLKNGFNEMSFRALVQRFSQTEQWHFSPHTSLNKASGLVGQNTSEGDTGAWDWVPGVSYSCLLRVLTSSHVISLGEAPQFWVWISLVVAFAATFLIEERWGGGLTRIRSPTSCSLFLSL